MNYDKDNDLAIAVRESEEHKESMAVQQVLNADAVEDALVRTLMAPHMES